jgi:hypothetical protein
MRSASYIYYFVGDIMIGLLLFGFIVRLKVGSVRKCSQHQTRAIVIPPTFRVSFRNTKPSKLSFQQTKEEWTQLDR